MSDNAAKKDHGPVDRVKELTGIYGLGFERESMMGFVLPFAVVIGIGGVLGLLIWLWL